MTNVDSVVADRVVDPLERVRIFAVRRHQSVDGSYCHEHMMCVGDENLDKLSFLHSTFVKVIVTFLPDLIEKNSQKDAVCSEAKKG